MKKLGIRKRILWIWERICLIFYFGAIGWWLFTGKRYDGIILLCTPTVLLMMASNGWIYSDKIIPVMTAKFWIIASIILIGKTIYEFFKNTVAFMFGLGVSIPFVLLMIIAAPFKEKAERGG